MGYKIGRGGYLAMITHQDVKRLLAEVRQPGICVAEILKVLQANRDDETVGGPGRTSMREAAGTFRIRRDSVAGLPGFCGMNETVLALSSRAADAMVLWFHFLYPEQIMTVFVDENSKDIVGCVRVTRQGGDSAQPSPGEREIALAVAP